MKIFSFQIGSTGAYRAANLLIFMYLVWQITQGNLTLGSFAGMVIAANALQGQLGMIFNFYTQAQEMSIYADKIKAFFELESVIEPEISGKEYATVPEGSFGIELKDMSFAYDNSNFNLKNINFSVKPGEKIAIVGENGAGKTTLTKLLLRLYDPTDGEILINGVSLKEYYARKLRLNIGVAFQDSPIYSSLTMAQNMTIYNDSTEANLLDVAKLLGLDRVMEKSNADLHSEVTREFDKNGLILSGGERQRLSLSRLFTGEFGLLILDEPTSSLDPLAEYEMNKIIFNRANKTTTVFISHRLSNIRDADCIYLIDGGVIAEKGTHSELMNMHGKYYEMFTKQAENYTKE
ncbi:MAG: ABC transporter ATP-binding protein/permease [Oscillospiraceae bacterium]|nr:ABC transporter ATP-binding protein/permease [Oscillospiraceae bacterium]